MIKLSIIIPVYNVQDYIKECIESILNQTINDIEIIVVDDGSLDNSIKIVKEFNDSRIKIITQENRGLSAARNSGIAIANGEYIAFVDSDDFIIDNKAYEEMYNIAINEGSDIVAGNCIWYYSELKNHAMDRDMSRFSYSPMTSIDYFIQCLKSYRIYAPVWLNIYKNELIKENKIYFKEGIFHEDEEFTPRILLKAKTVSIYDKNFYGYRQRSGSIMNSEKNIKKCKDIINTCMDMNNIAKGLCNKELKLLLEAKIVSTIQDTIYKYEYRDVSDKIKLVLLDNSKTNMEVFRTKLIIKNVKLYFKIEKIIRLIKKIK